MPVLKEKNTKNKTGFQSQNADNTPENRDDFSRSSINLVARLVKLQSKIEIWQAELVKEQKKAPEHKFFQALGLKVFHSFDEVETLWVDFEQEATSFVYQRYSFCRTWYETVGKKSGDIIHIVVVHNQFGETQMLLPLVLNKGHFGTSVSFVGDGIADYMCPLVQNEFAMTLENAEFETLWKRILASFDTKIDLVWLDRQPVSIKNVPNPLASLGGFDFASCAHALDFPQANDWAQCARKLRSNKTVKKIERRIRNLAMVGKLELREAIGAENRRRHMEQLLELKIENLNYAGTLHKMDKAEIAAFYQTLVVDSAMEDTLHQFELLCDNKLVSSVLGFVHNGTFFYQICAFNRQEFGQHSPGSLLLYQLFDWGFSRGLKCFDMTIGDELYKNDWSNRSTRLKTVALPYSTKGYLVYALNRTLLVIKKFIKGSDLLRKLAIRLLKWQF